MQSQRRNANAHTELKQLITSICTFFSNPNFISLYFVFSTRIVLKLLIIVFSWIAQAVIVLKFRVYKRGILFELWTWWKTFWRTFYVSAAHYDSWSVGVTDITSGKRGSVNEGRLWLSFCFDDKVSMCFDLHTYSDVHREKLSFPLCLFYICINGSSNWELLQI